MQKAWTDDAWADYVHWQTEDKKTLKRINVLLKDVDHNPFSGIGKPEPLYKVEHEQIVITQCGGYYDE